MEEIIIDNYGRLSLGKYREIYDISRDESLEDIDKQVKIISVLTDMAEEDILNLPIQQYKELAAKSRFLEVAPRNPSRLAESYRIGGFELIPVMDMRKVTTAQYIDFQTFHQAGMDEHFVEILSCLLVPKGKKYNQDYDIIKVQDAIRDELNVLEGGSLYAFFLISCRESIKDMLTYSLQEAKRIKNPEKRKEMEMKIQEQMDLLMRSGDGSPM